MKGTATAMKSSGHPTKEAPVYKPADLHTCNPFNSHALTAAVKQKIVKPISLVTLWQLIGNPNCNVSSKVDLLREELASKEKKHNKEQTFEETKHTIMWKQYLQLLYVSVFMSSNTLFVRMY